MKINGGIRYMERGIDVAIRAMQVQTQLMAVVLIRYMLRIRSLMDIHTDLLFQEVLLL